MFRKDPETIQEWSENNLRLCSERQQRILTHIWPCLKPGGKLIYSTCTYNPAENECILEWLVDTWGAESIPISHPFSNITASKSTAYGYHFYPHKTEGEGFFKLLKWRIKNLFGKDGLKDIKTQQREYKKLFYNKVYTQYQTVLDTFVQDKYTLKGAIAKATYNGHLRRSKAADLAVRVMFVLGML